MSGIGRYTADMIASMATLGKDAKFILDSHPSKTFSYLLELTAVSVVTDRREIEQISEWATIWGPAHRLPFYKPNNLHLVVTIHDLTWKKFPQTMSLLGYTSAFFNFGYSVKQAHKIICISESTASDLMHYYPNTRNKISVIYPAIIHKGTTANYHHGRPFALFVGTFEPRKNLKNLIKAFAENCTELHGELDIVIAGQAGWGNVDILALIKKYQLAPYVKIVKHPDDNLLGALYKGCAFLVMPSLYEGFGLPVIEAKYYGKRAVVSNNSSLKEIAAADDELIDPLNPMSIAWGMKKMYYRISSRS
jgi:glycosyltransferase involved in cell wall biosynthesis